MLAVTQPDTPLLRSFGRRKGKKLYQNKKRVLQEVLPKLSVDCPEDTHIDIEALFGNAHPLHLEIGFGQGEHLAANAAQHPTRNYIGCEPFINGVAHLCALVEEQELTNVRVYPDDAWHVLHALPAQSVAGCELLFPDPWPKSKHKKRRIVNALLLDRLAALMPQGALLQFATDNADYAEQMLALIAEHAHWQWTAEQADDWRLPPKGWVETKYQVKDNKHGGQSVFIAAVRI